MFCALISYFHTAISLINAGSSSIDELGFLAQLPKGLSGGVFVNLDGDAIATMSYAADEVVPEWVKVEWVEEHKPKPENRTFFCN